MKTKELKEHFYILFTHCFTFSLSSLAKKENQLPLPPNSADGKRGEMKKIPFYDHFWGPFSLFFFSLSRQICDSLGLNQPTWQAASDTKKTFFPFLLLLLQFLYLLISGWKWIIGTNLFSYICPTVFTPCFFLTSTYRYIFLPCTVLTYVAIY